MIDPLLSLPVAYYCTLYNVGLYEARWLTCCELFSVHAHALYLLDTSRV